jgi:hypothetical protein
MAVGTVGVPRHGPAAVTKPPIQQWNGVPNASTTQSNPTLTPAETANLTPPAVPSSSGSGSGTTVVNTPSMDTFATNIGNLVGPVKDAYTKLAALAQVEPGQFYDAYQLQGDVSGASGATSDLVSNYIGVLKNLGNGLTDIQSAATTMSQKYTSVNDLNNIKVSDLNSDLSNSQSDFTNMMDANGGSSSSGGSGGSSGPGKSGSGSGKSGSGGKS